MLWSGLFASAALVAGAAAQSNPTNSRLQSILDSAANSSLYQYPTSLTQGILPIFVHSHNDYWRPVPFYSALAAGVVSVEADVWLKKDGELHVGHEQSALTAERTFDKLYVQPILSVLEAQNPSNPYAPGTTDKTPRTANTTDTTKHGVFDTSSGQTLYLFVDLKTDGATTWPHVVRALQPLRSAGYLTSFNGTAVVQGAVTVIGTGNTPLSLVQGVAPRDYFYDAPLALLNGTYSNITASVSPIASTDFAVQFGDVRNTQFTDSQLALLRDQVTTAHAKGIKVRYWDQPGWPIDTRNAVWRTLWENDVDLLNVDDLEAAVNF